MSYNRILVLFLGYCLDYGNATLAGLPAYQHQRLQSVLNAAARLVHLSSRYDHITPILRDLHWLKSPERIDFKIGVLVTVVCTVLRRSTCRTTSIASRTRTVVVSGRHRHHFWLSDERDSVPSATVPSQWSAVASGTLFPFLSPLLHLSLSSGHASNHTCLNDHSRQTVTDTYLQCLHRTVV